MPQTTKELLISNNIHPATLGLAVYNDIRQMFRIPDSNDRIARSLHFYDAVPMLGERFNQAFDRLGCTALRASVEIHRITGEDQHFVVIHNANLKDRDPLIVDPTYKRLLDQTAPITLPNVFEGSPTEIIDCMKRYAIRPDAHRLYLPATIFSYDS